ncbi:HTH-type transcriptional activator CmpR [compost metagenome]
MIQWMDIMDSMELPLDFAPLRMLVAIARYGTLTEAARRLHLSQPAATHQIRQLERQLGVALFERRGRGLALTDAGRLAVDRATRALAEWEGLAADLEALAGLDTGHVRLGGGTTAIVHLLPALIGSFRLRHPGVSFYMREGPTGPITEAIAAGELDLGIVTLPSERSGLVVEPWLDDAVRFLAWPGAPLAEASSLTDLEGAPFILPEPGMPLRQLIDGVLQVAGVSPQPVMELQSIEAIKASVEAGLGYAALGERTVARELSEGRLVALPITGPGLKRQLGLTYRASAPLSPAVAAFLAHLRAGLPAPPHPTESPT